jgi:sialate O-acetylesterase
MVLQRAPQRAFLWGYTDTFDAPIILTLNERVYRTKSSSFVNNSFNESIWSITLDPQSEEGPFQIDVIQPLPNGTLVTIQLVDVLFGDVWICSGQSNMELPVSYIFNASIEIANAVKYPKIRLFTSKHDQSDEPVDELLRFALNWTVASPKSVGDDLTSAVCWLYGRMVYDGLGGRPMGLIHSSWGATEIEFWSPPQALKDCGILS